MGVVGRGGEPARLDLDHAEALVHLADQLAERLGELDVRADRAVEQLLRDGIHLGPDLSRVGGLDALGLGDHDLRRGRRWSLAAGRGGAFRTISANACATISGTDSGSRPFSFRLYLTAIVASIS